MFVEDHDRAKYRPHSAALYLLNMLVNLAPGMVLYPIVATCLIFPSLEKYVPRYNPWINIGMVEMPIEEMDGPLDSIQIIQHLEYIE